MSDDIWLTDDEQIEHSAEQKLDALFPDLAFVDLIGCVKSDIPKATLDGRFTAAQLRAIASAIDSIALSSNATVSRAHEND
jgi:capsid protein